MSRSKKCGNRDFETVEETRGRVNQALDEDELAPRARHSATSNDAVADWDMVELYLIGLDRALENLQPVEAVN